MAAAAVGEEEEQQQEAAALSASAHASTSLTAQRGLRLQRLQAVAVAVAEAAPLTPQLSEGRSPLQGAAQQQLALCLQHPWPSLGGLALVPLCQHRCCASGQDLEGEEGRSSLQATAQQPLLLLLPVQEAVCALQC